MCVFMRACVHVSSEISQMRGHSTIFITPSWRASPGTLGQLLLNLTGCLVWEKYPYKILLAMREPCPLSVQYLRNWSSLKELSFLDFQLGCSKEKDRLRCMVSFGKLGKSCGVWRGWGGGQSVWFGQQAVVS